MNERERREEGRKERGRKRSRKDVVLLTGYYLRLKKSRTKAK